MTQFLNPVNVQPHNVPVGAIMVRQLVVHIPRPGRYRIYLCPSDRDGCQYSDDEIPQGMNVTNSLPHKEWIKLFWAVCQLKPDL